MNITFLGHAGFLVKCNDEQLLIDPWLNPSGAYAASWFPYPPSDHIDPKSFESVQYLYISHWHQDHFDKWLLNGMSQDFKKKVIVLISNFKYSKLRNDLSNLGYENIIEVSSTHAYHTALGMEIRIIREENPFFIDSAIAVHCGGVTFFNANDYKVSIEQERWLNQLYGPIDLYAAQFSGATFHPACYNYSEEELRTIVYQRRIAKFERIIDSIKRLEVKHYIPSAGPACFLSNDLVHLNEKDTSIFSTAKELRKYFVEAQPELVERIVDLLPAQTIILDNATPIQIAGDRAFEETIEEYAFRKKIIIKQELQDHEAEQENLLEESKLYFTKLLSQVPSLAVEANCILELIITDVGILYIDTVKGKISYTKIESPLQRYTFELTAFWMKALLNKRISWEDFILSFRFKISRIPDTYNEAIIAFLHLETDEERSDYVEYRRALRLQTPDRICRWYDGQIIEHNRFCPHNGEDLTNAHIENGVLTCPKHFWQFSLSDGRGINNSETINVNVPE